MVLALIVVVALVAWFFLARLTMYEYSTGFSVTEDGRLYASFQPESMPRIRTGQSALLRLTFTEDNQQVTLPALVINKLPGDDQVEILVLGGELPAGIGPGDFSARVEVEAEYISPANLVMRASGQFLNQGQVPVSPQRFQNQAP
jgi:hypothetical protein